MTKGYISGWKEQKEQDDNEQKKSARRMDVFFDHRPSKAAWWHSREDAQRDVNIFENWHIVIPSATGGTYVCKDFQVEEFEPERFVIFCEAPFLPPRSEGYGKTETSKQIE